MNLEELYKPKIGKNIGTMVGQYIATRPSVKDYGFKADDEFEKKLQKMGWRLLDTGKFSAVFENPSKNFILKVTYRVDKGYEHYVNIIKRSRNPHFPKIGDMKVIPYGGNNYYVYLIEKLNPLHGYERFELVRNLDSVINRPNESLISIFERHYGVPIPEYLSSQPKLVQALRIIGKNIGKQWNDLHAGNIMKRKDGTIVITDPYS